MAVPISNASRDSIGPDEKQLAYTVASRSSVQAISRSHSPSPNSQHIVRCYTPDCEMKGPEAGRSLTSSSEGSSLDARIAPKSNTSSTTKHKLLNRTHLLSAWPWWWELGACIGSVASFLAILGLLCVYNGKAQPDWPYGTTVNSAVSSLSTMMKGFLLVPWAACISQSIWISYMSKPQVLERLRIYDEASRGPLGALELIWTLKGR